MLSMKHDVQSGWSDFYAKIHALSNELKTCGSVTDDEFEAVCLILGADASWKERIHNAVARQGLVPSKMRDDLVSLEQMDSPLTPTKSAFAATGKPCHNPVCTKDGRKPRHSWAAHYEHDINRFDHYKILSSPESILSFSGDKISAIGSGQVTYHLHNGKSLILTNVFHTPHAHASLISVGQLADDGYDTTFNENGFIFQHSPLIK
jgi:hypothetical protein